MIQWGEYRQMQYKIICEDVIDRRSYTHNLKMKFKPEKSRPEQDLNPWPLWYWCSALPTELSSQLGAIHIVSL